MFRFRKLLRNMGPGLRRGKRQREKASFELQAEDIPSRGGHEFLWFLRWNIGVSQSLSPDSGIRFSLSRELHYKCRGWRLGCLKIRRRQSWRRGALLAIAMPADSDYLS